MNNLGIQKKESKILKLFEKNPIILIQEFSKNNQDDLEGRFPNEKLIVCDFYIENIEKKGVEDVGGYKNGNITNIDHHAQTLKMAKRISSTTLAIEYAQKNKTKFPKIAIINHTDYDSILSSCIGQGILPSDNKFNNAAIAADHTGEKNGIADLLQSLKDERNIEFSLRNLELFIKGKTLEPRATELLQKRMTDRTRAIELVKSGLFKSINNIYYLLIEERIAAELLPSLIPNAEVILIASPMKNDSSKLELKIRLGINAPEGFCLNTLNLPDFGGRWNAGNTKRFGGTSLPLEKYAILIWQKLEDFKSKK